MPLTSADYFSDMGYGQSLTSQPNAGRSGTSGIFGQYGALPGIGASGYQFQDINLPAAQTNPAIPQLTSRSAIEAYRLAEMARQEAASKSAENRTRGNAILAGYDQNIAQNRGMSDQILAQNASYGDSMRQSLANDYKTNLAASNQSAIRRGLGNTTIRDSLNRGVRSQYDLARMQLGDQLTQRNIGLTTDAMGRDNQLTNARLGFLGSIQNDYPTSADIANYYLQSGVLEETKTSRK